MFLFEGQHKKYFIFVLKMTTPILINKKKIKIFVLKMGLVKT